MALACLQVRKYFGLVVLRPAYQDAGVAAAALAGWAAAATVCAQLRDARCLLHGFQLMGIAEDLVVVRFAKDSAIIHIYFPFAMKVSRRTAHRL